MEQVGDWIHEALMNRNDEEKLASIRSEVRELNRNYPQQGTGKFLPDNPSRSITSLGYSKSYDRYDGFEDFGDRFGVRLLLPVDEYKKTYRSTNFAYLFIFITFLAYFLVRTRNYFGKTILCHADKNAKNKEDENAICQVWEGGQKVLEGLSGSVKETLAEHMATTDLIIMDGCSLPINLTGFRGTLIMAASPSLYVK